jgi:hypothetical protein
MALAEVTKDSMQAAFAVYAQVHEAASDPPMFVDMECVVHLPL